MTFPYRQRSRSMSAFREIRTGCLRRSRILSKTVWKASEIMDGSRSSVKIRRCSPSFGFMTAEPVLPRRICPICLTGFIVGRARSHPDTASGWPLENRLSPDRAGRSPPATIRTAGRYSTFVFLYKREFIMRSGDTLSRTHSTGYIQSRFSVFWNCPSYPHPWDRPFCICRRKCICFCRI